MNRAVMSLRLGMLLAAALFATGCQSGAPPADAEPPLAGAAIGGPFVGWFSDQFGARAGLGLGGVAAIVTGIVSTPALGRLRDDLAGPVVSGPEPEVAPAV